MQPSSTRLGEVVDALVEGWRAALAPSGWAVVDGPLTGATGLAAVLIVGVGNDVDGDPYRVETSEHDWAGRHREDGVIRCQASVVVSDGRDIRAAREVVLAALSILDTTLRRGAAFLLDGVADGALLGVQRWWHLLDASQGEAVISVDIDVHWSAYL